MSHEYIYLLLFRSGETRLIDGHRLLAIDSIAARRWCDQGIHPRDVDVRGLKLDNLIRDDCLFGWDTSSEPLSRDPFAPSTTFTSPEDDRPNSMNRPGVFLDTIVTQWEERSYPQTSRSIVVRSPGGGCARIEDVTVARLPIENVRLSGGIPNAVRDVRDEHLASLSALLVPPHFDWDAQACLDAGLASEPIGPEGESEFPPLELQGRYWTYVCLMQSEFTPGKTSGRRRKRWFFVFSYVLILAGLGAAAVANGVLEFDFDTWFIPTLILVAPALLWGLSFEADADPPQVLADDWIQLEYGDNPPSWVTYQEESDAGQSTSEADLGPGDFPKTQVVHNRLAPQERIAPPVPTSESPPKSEHGPRVFISYSQHNYTEVANVVTELESAGVRCWFAARDITPGTQGYHEKIMAAIRDSWLVAVLVSRSSLESPHVLNELEIATNQRKTMLPIVLEDLRPGEIGNAGYFLQRFQMVRFPTTEGTIAKHAIALARDLKIPL